MRTAHAQGSGIGLRLAATGLFAAMSLCVRLAALDGAPVGQIVFYRSAVALAPIVLYLAWQGRFPAALRTARPGGHLGRSLTGCAGMVLSFVSLAYLPLALATALGFLSPLLVVPFAITVLGERPGRVVVVAALLGFGGVGLMLAPALGGPAADTATLVGIAAGIVMAAVNAASRVQVKALTATEATGTIAFYFALVCALAGLATMPFGWIPMGGRVLAALVGSGLLGGLAHITMTEALARAPASTLAPFEYTALVWALLLDAAVFGVLPGAAGLAGALVVVLAAGLVAVQDRLPATRPATAS